MPVVDLVNGVVVPRRIGEPLAAGVSAARTEFGFGVTNPANTIREVVEALGALPWDAREQDILELSRQFDPRRNVGQFLEASLWPLFRRRTPSAAAGIVNLNYRVIPSTPAPLFGAGDLEFTDGAGVRYTGTGDVQLPSAIHDTSGQTGTSSETIGSGNTRIAQKITVNDHDFPQAVRLQVVNALTATPVANVRIETDSAGAPSGVLAHARFLVTAFPLVDGTNDIVFEKGAKLATGSYWIVLQVSGGTVSFDGGTGGASNQVQFYNGSVWANSATVENLNVKLYNGGEFTVVATQLGILGNIAVDSIGSVRTNSGGAQTVYDANVASFENLEAFEGGRNLEGDEVLRTRARIASAARGTSSPGGIVFGLQDGTVDGVTFVDILENDTLVWGQTETILNNSAKTGSSGDLIDGATYYKTAQKFIVSGHHSIAAFAFKLAADTASTLSIRIETDAAGSPSGNLAKPTFEKTGVVPAGTTRVAAALAVADFIDSGTFWLVVTRSAGSFRLDGSNSGATDNVKRYTGSAWELSTALEDMNVELYGGVPGKSFELFVEGGSDDDVAQGIHDLRAPGILAYGPVSGNAMDVAGRNVVQYFARPINVDVVFDVELQTTSTFGGSADDIRDLLAEYVAELGIQDPLIRFEALGRLIAGDLRSTGIKDVLKFRLGKKTAFATPVDLTSAEVVNLTNNFGERFRIANPSTDIKVTLTPG